MSMDINTVHKVARLAALDIDDAGAEKIAPQLSNILGFIEQLSEVNTEGVEPLANVVDIELALRKDEITDGDCREKVLANAPEETHGFFVVPTVVEQES